MTSVSCRVWPSWQHKCDPYGPRGTLSLTCLLYNISLYTRRWCSRPFSRSVGKLGAGVCGMWVILYRYGQKLLTGRSLLQTVNAKFSRNLFIYFEDEARCFHHARRHIHLQDVRFYYQTAEVLIRRVVPACGVRQVSACSPLNSHVSGLSFETWTSWARWMQYSFCLLAIPSSQLTSFLQLCLLTFCIFLIPSVHSMYRVLEDLGVERIIILKWILNE